MNPGIPAASLALLALTNLVALVWGAAKVSSAVERLTSWADKADHKLDDHETRIARIEGSQQ